MGRGQAATRPFQRTSSPPKVRTDAVGSPSRSSSARQASGEVVRASASVRNRAACVGSWRRTVSCQPRARNASRAPAARAESPVASDSQKPAIASSNAKPSVRAASRQARAWGGSGGVAGEEERLGEGRVRGPLHRVVGKAHRFLQRLAVAGAGGEQGFSEQDGQVGRGFGERGAGLLHVFASGEEQGADAERVVERGAHSGFLRERPAGFDPLRRIRVAPRPGRGRADARQRRRDGAGRGAVEKRLDPRQVGVLAREIARPAPQGRGPVEQGVGDGLAPSARLGERHQRVLPSLRSLQIVMVIDG